MEFQPNFVFVGSLIACTLCSVRDIRGYEDCQESDRLSDALQLLGGQVPWQTIRPESTRLGTLYSLCLLKPSTPRWKGRSFSIPLQA